MAEKNLNQDNKANHGIIDFHFPTIKEMESLVHEQNKRFQVICSSKNDAIITSDESKRILFWNNGAEHIFGYTSEEAIGQPLTLIIPSDLHRIHPANYADAS